MLFAATVSEVKLDGAKQKRLCMQCGAWDFIIVADTNAKARALLQNRCNDSQIILHTTQRFDAGMEGDHKLEWTALIKDALVQMPNLYLVANNPYEVWYAQTVRKAKFFTPRLIRPTGHWPGKWQLKANIGDVNADASPAVVVQPYIPYLNHILLGNLSLLGMNVVMLQHQQYGGAAALASFKCVIQFPYQVCFEFHGYLDSLQIHSRS